MWWFCRTCVLLECISKVYFWSVFLECITLEGENKGSGPPSFCCTCVLQECNWSVLPSVPQVYRSVFISRSTTCGGTLLLLLYLPVTRVCFLSVLPECVSKVYVWTESGDQSEFQECVSKECYQSVLPERVSKVRSVDWVGWSEWISLVCF